MKTFLELNIKQEIKDAIAEMGFSQPTPIQAEVIPSILNGKDCLAQAPTGTGKTCAFGIPLVNMVDTKNPSVQAVVLCPTRELAMQTEKELKKLAMFLTGVKVLAVYGGQPIERQLAGIRKKPQIIVGTPGRIIDHLRRRTLKLQGAKMVVLDEADEMLDMGFRDDMKSILSEMPDTKQSMLFSATMPQEILEISRQFQTDPVSVKTTILGEDMPPITQYFVKLKESTKYNALLQIIRDKDYKFVLVFTNTKRKASELDAKLQADFYLSSALHGDLRQKVRDTVMRSFREKQINILVATDVAARGIDVENVEAVFNFDVPLDEEYYIHRLGRTARANKTGIAYSFVTARDIGRLNLYEKLTGATIQELKLAGLSEDKLSKSKPKSATDNKSKSDDGNKPKSETDFKSKSGGGYNPKRETTNKKTSNDRYKPKSATSYKSKNDDGNKQKSETDYKSKSSSGYKSKSGSGYKPKSRDGYKPKSETDYKSKNSGGYKQKNETTNKKTSDDGYKPKADNKKGVKGKSAGADYRKFRNGAKKKKSPFVTFGDNKPKRR